MQGRCSAYLEDGRTCGRPATRLDTPRGGLVCGLCTEADRRRAILRAAAEATLRPELLAAWTRTELLSGSHAPSDEGLR